LWAAVLHFEHPKQHSNLYANPSATKIDFEGIDQHQWIVIKE